MLSPIFLDIDGTLLNSNYIVTKRTREALKEANKIGHKIILCSGRAVSALEDVLSQLKIKTLLATLNGAYITDEERSVISSSPLPKEDALKLISLIKEEGLEYMYFFNEQWGAEKNSRVYDIEYAAVKRKGTEAPIEEILKRETILKLLSFGKGEQNKRFIKRAKELYPEYEIAPSSTTYTEINTPHVNKAFAVKTVCSYLNIDTKAAICFGDYNNDIPMFKTVGTKIAMGNAIAEVKALATEITKSNNEDGIAIWIENNLLK